VPEIGGAILYVLALWWFGTGIILYLDGLPRRTFPLTLVGATVLLVGAFAAMVATREEVTVAGAVLGFTSAIVVWGFNEVAFLTGYITGPRREAADPGARGLRRFGQAVAALLHHEAALLVSLAAVAAATFDAPNDTAFWTFALLFVLRVSTKLNIFLGVPYNAVGFLPPHLGYLESYFGRRGFNPFFPVSAIGATALVVVLVGSAAAAQSGHGVASLVLLATLAALGLFEHWVLMLPVRMADLWAWALVGRRTGASADDPRAIERCTIRLAAPCDASRMSRVLDDVARGSFGAVERLDGRARTPDGYIAFALEGGRAHLSPVGSAGTHEIGAVAIGRTLDTSRLQAAFDGCAVATAA